MAIAFRCLVTPGVGHVAEGEEKINGDGTGEDVMRHEEKEVGKWDSREMGDWESRKWKI